MKKVLKRVLVAASVMVVTLAAGVFTACSIRDPEGQKKQQGYSYCVTYDANGGSFGSGATKTYALVKENSLTPAPGYVDGNTQASVKAPTRRDYQLVNEAKSDGDDETNDEAILSKSWFLAKTDAEGNIVYEGEGENRQPVLLSNEPWDFTKNRVTGDITLVAKWSEVFRFAICIVDTNADGERVEQQFRTFTVEPGDSIADKLYKKEGSEIVRRADKIRISQTGYTLLDFYLDEGYTTLLPTDYVHPGRREVEVTQPNPETGVEETVTVQTNTVTVYVKYLKGKYDLITQDNVKSLTGASKWYLLEDVDLTGKTWEAVSRFNGEILGNGFALKNVTVTSKAVKTNNYKAHSIFGTMNGNVENVTFENVTMQVYTDYGASVIGEQRVNFFAYSFTEEGSMKNVTAEDCKIVLKVVGDGGSSLFAWQTGTNGGLWWTAPNATQSSGVTVKENGGVVTSISVVQE